MRWIWNKENVKKDSRKETGETSSSFSCNKLLVSTMSSIEEVVDSVLLNMGIDYLCECYGHGVTC